jgi:hypothetical protein
VSVASVVAAWLVLSGPWLFPGPMAGVRDGFVGARLHVGPGVAPIELGARRCHGPVVL